MTKPPKVHKTARRGFKAMSPETQREIASKGGLTVSKNRRHMADIGRVGGTNSHGGKAVYTAKPVKRAKARK